MYQHLPLNCKLNFLISGRVYNNQNFARNHQTLNNKPGFAYFYSIMVDIIKSTKKQFDPTMKYKCKSDLDDNDKNLEFKNVNFFVKKINI